MKVLNLVCAHQHLFEGWFASEEDYQAQGEAGQLSCPMCGDSDIGRLPTAPRLNVSRPREDERPAVPIDDASERKKIQSEALRALRQMMENTEDVGERFPEEARRIHYGESKGRGIRGRATREEAEALVDEGIEVMALPVPLALKGSTH